MNYLENILDKWEVKMSGTPIEIERKYVIIKPMFSELTDQGDVEISEIDQTYLCSKAGETRRVRKRAYTDRVVYTETVKRRIDHMSSYEDEREISEDEYIALLSEKASGTVTLTKTRYALYYRGTCFEVDIYPEWKYTCILETELSSPDEKPEFPPLIKVIAEVTGDRRYSNAAMSESFPPELV